MKRTTSGNNTVRRFVPLTTDLYFYPCIDLAEVVEELLGGGLLRHLEDLDPRRGHRGGERLEELRQRVHLADALHLQGIRDYLNWLNTELTNTSLISTCN